MKYCIREYIFQTYLTMYTVYFSVIFLMTGEGLNEKSDIKGQFFLFHFDTF